jgi:hypothetical protein
MFGASGDLCLQTALGLCFGLLPDGPDSFMQWAVFMRQHVAMSAGQ